MHRVENRLQKLSSLTRVLLAVSWIESKAEIVRQNSGVRDVGFTSAQAEGEGKGEFRHSEV